MARSVNQRHVDFDYYCTHTNSTSQSTEDLVATSAAEIGFPSSSNKT